ncbi:RyR domain-containing protein [Imhoffiella purpurea]|uniref:Ryanodine receptor Ryr domain-containing protein n=1 Tax=Imhoffiella purpurea TaxID=1249627 RepID=W9W3N5_9GAMM|nr:RyR domain-containing protein [Imhoffiella purpurea]EXJ17175.1 hypothetical protein D779_0002 [Imhoffiella purpurea]
MSLFDSPIHVLGSEPLVEQVVDGLIQSGRAAVAATLERLESRRPRRLRTLILADPPDPVSVLERSVQALGRGRRWGRGPSLRVILMHRRDPPPELPTPDPRFPLRLETFSIESRGVRALLTAWPLHRGMDPLFGQAPHLLVAGLDHPVPAFLLQASRLIHYGALRPRLTILDSDPEAAAEGLLSAYPQAGQIADLGFGRLDRPPLAGMPPVTLVLVCLPDAMDLGLDRARELARTIVEEQGVSPAILIETGGRVTQGEVSDWDGQTVPVSCVREACRPGVLLDGIGDEMARSIHDHYRDSIAAQGRDPDREPAGRPWESLPVSYRQANRHQADHLWAKLAVTDCKAVAEEMVDSFAFTPLEVERLAVIEHRRWAADRYLDGWSYAPQRDNALKHHPQLVPYAELSEAMKDLDRFAVRGVPSLLARTGLGVVRTLILAVRDDPGPELGRSGVRRRLVPLLERLVNRYPDRALVCASTLATPRARQLVRTAMEHAGSGLFWLLHRPIPALLEAQPDAEARSDLLDLAARAERRIALAGPPELRRWYRERAEILVTWDHLTEPDPFAESGGFLAKRVGLVAGGPVWNFEY